MAGAISWDYDKYGKPPGNSAPVEKVVRFLDGWNTSQAKLVDGVGGAVAGVAGAVSVVGGVGNWVMDHWRLVAVGFFALFILIKRI